jgi:hypothetical protein
MKLQPYVQSSVLPRAHEKLSYKFFGPYCVANRVISVAYRLELPDSSRIHPVVHVSQLKLAKGFSCSATSSLPDELPEFSIPLRILQTRVELLKVNDLCNMFWCNGPTFQLIWPRGKTKTT